MLSGGLFTWHTKLSLFSLCFIVKFHRKFSFGPKSWFCSFIIELIHPKQNSKEIKVLKTPFNWLLVDTLLLQLTVYSSSVILPNDFVINNLHTPFEKMPKSQFTDVWNPDCYMNKELYLAQREDNSFPKIHSLHSSQSEDANVSMSFHCSKLFNNSHIPGDEDQNPSQRVYMAWLWTGLQPSSPHIFMRSPVCFSLAFFCQLLNKTIS